MRFFYENIEYRISVKTDIAMTVYDLLKEVANQTPFLLSELVEGFKTGKVSFLNWCKCITQQVGDQARNSR